ncbi:MAG TPA: protease pro-enzyme activation domain-containing protein [Bryobacteraceae bacterium]|nr:protease pro-enzyme activation domain-containing protein [Bryobacteraceae bacterium]
MLVAACFAAVGSLEGQVRPRLPKIVDNSSVVRLTGTTHPLAIPANENGRAAADLPMDRMLLQLKSSPEQQAELDQLVAEQHDPSSPHYQEWLTPEQFGERFGPAREDLEVIAGWLEARGFRVDEVAAGRRVIEFSGTARQVERAFQTEMRHYLVNGERHLANASDISIPEALASVVEGVVSLHDFRSRPQHHVAGSGLFAPAANLSGGGHAISPYDFAAIYNVAALWNLGFDGTGQTIAIAGRTNIKTSDITSFRSQFGLTGNNAQVFVNGTNPGVISANEEMEADLDVEWAGAVAKGATIQLVVSADTNTSDGVTLSASYIVNHSPASVMSLSFGACEAEMGGSNSFFNSLWEQAAGQGISVFISAGDSGSAGCDIDYSTNSKGQNTTLPASHGFGVNGLASTPYNVAVGGTQFLDTAQPSAYWNTGNDAHLASAKGYIPEAVWNQSSYTTSGASGNNLYAGSGGASTVYGTPSWQSASGVPASDPTSGGHHRYLPDVSLSAGGNDWYLVEQEGGLYLVGGTSVSSPAFAGILAILNQYSNARTGNANAKFYPLASKPVFHDVTTGTNAVPCAGGSSGCSAAAPSTTIGKMNGFAAGAGYDLATGLGSVDAYALALAWSNKTAVPPAITSLSPNPMIASASSQTLTINGSGFQAGLTVAASYTGYATNLAITSVSATQIQAVINTGTTARTWTVQVTNSNKAASNSVSLTVNAAPAPAPAITSLSPNPMTVSTSSQTLTINGSGFQAGLTVAASYTGYSTSLQVTSVSATQIQAVINVGTTARAWTLQVTNPNKAVSNAMSLQVNAAPVAAPAITSATLKSNQLVIAGSGFQAGLSLIVTFSSNKLSAQGWQIVSVSSTQIVVSVSASAATGAQTVQVANPNGQTSKAVTIQRQ